MNEATRNQTHQYFQSAKSLCQREIAALQADHRSDEAVFTKIRLNVYDIFQTVLSAAEKAAGENDELMRQFFMERLTQIPRNWESALSKAEQHENAEAAHIEHIKLDTVGQIKEDFSRIWEVTL